MWKLFEIQNLFEYNSHDNKDFGGRGKDIAKKRCFIHKRVKDICSSWLCMYVPFVKYLFIYFNWRLITLQHCGGFCHTFTWINMCSPSWTPLPPTSPSHPSGSSQCTSPEHPVSCIKPRLAIYFTYDNIYVSMLFSQIIPPSPSPTESKSLFFTSVSLLLSHI